MVAGIRGRSSAVEVRRELDDIYALLIRVLSGVDEHALAELRAALAELSRSRARNGFTPSETALGVFSLKDAVYELMADAAELMPEYLAFSRLIDDLGLHIFETFAAARERIIADQAASMMELSTPVVRLWDGIIAVPLVGTLDSARTQVVMEKLLETLVATGADHAVLDITGVATVDTEVAQHLLKTVNAARLLGAECIVSGIRPQVAQTIVSLGIEFGDIATKATLADALGVRAGPRGAEGHQGEPGLMERVPILKLGRTLFVSIQIDLQDESVMRLQEDLADELAATECERRDHRHHRGGDRRLLHRPDADHDRFHLPAVRRRDGPGRDAPGGGDHPYRAGTVPTRRAHRPECGKGAAAPERKPLMHELPIQSGDDVVRVRQQVRVVAAECGLSLVDQTKVITAASELARNTLVHGGGGTAHVEVITSAHGRSGIRINFTDEGPGIADIDPGSDRWLDLGQRIGPGPVWCAPARGRI